MKVLLIRPNTFESVKGMGMPLSLGYLASSLIKDGNKVKVLDLMLYPKEKSSRILQETINKFNPGICGITANSPERFEAFNLARIVKREKSIPVVLGGVHVTFSYEESLRKVPEIDVAILGEGEDTFRELCRFFTGEIKNLQEIKGIAFRKDDMILKTDDRPFLEDLDKLPFPARELFDVDKYELFLPIKGRPQTTQIITSRGCPFNCAYCSAKEFRKRTVGWRSAENIVDEIDHITRKYPQFETIFIYDDHFTSNKKRAISVCNEILRRGIRIKWACYGRADSIDEELAEKLKKAGCIMVSFGIESGSNKVLKLMQKGITSEKAGSALKVLKKYGIWTRCSIFFGYPGENWLDIIKTFAFLIYNRVKSTEVIFGYHPIIFPNTKLYRDLVKTGYLPDNFSWVDKKINLPCYKNVPIYVTSCDKLRLMYIKGLKLLYKVYSKFVLK